jgi:hypothetical protein
MLRSAADTTASGVSNHSMTNSPTIHAWRWPAWPERVPSGPAVSDLRDRLFKD